jgi:nitrite reductase/ring-hydroxylating ferredoxin subunit
VNKKNIVAWDELVDRVPAHAVVGNVDMVIVRYDDAVSVLYGRCAHRGALMSDGHIEGDNIICGVHGWDYRVDTGISEYDNSETLPKFNAWVEDGAVYVDEDEINAWSLKHPQPYDPPIRVPFRIRPGRPMSRTSNLFASWPTMGSANSAITVLLPRWVCRVTSCQSGMICSSLSVNCTNCRYSMMSRSRQIW